MTLNEDYYEMSCPRCGSYDINKKLGYYKCESCHTNLSHKELRDWHQVQGPLINKFNFIKRHKGDWGDAAKKTF